MIGFSLSQLTAPLDAQLRDGDASFTSVSTDTRTLCRGELFVALVGPSFDGHDYLERAAQLGAAAVMVSREPPPGLPGLLVGDTRIGLGRLAALWRRASRAALVAVTGSNGKTTVKEMIAAILARSGDVLATEGNLNNDIGLPLTLLRLQGQPYAVVEMGASHPGEIAYLSGIACPDLALINNAGRAHLEGFGDMQGVARAKAEIIAGLADGGRLVVNADDHWAPLWRELADDHPLTTFGIENEAQVSSPRNALVLEWSDADFTSTFPLITPRGTVQIRLALPGEHNRMNALAAAAAASGLGVGLDQIAAGLAAMRPVKGRMQPLAGRGGIGLINDSYNANPESVEAAIDVLASAPGQRCLVLGEMAEMGSGGAGFYHEIGGYAKNAGIERLFTLGAAGPVQQAFGDGGEQFGSLEQLIGRLEDVLRPGDRVLVKGSRCAAMERVVERLSGGEVH